MEYPVREHAHKQTYPAEADVVYTPGDAAHGALVLVFFRKILYLPSFVSSIRRR